jgi:hypothetical protein
MLIAALIFSVLSFIFSVINFIELRAQKLSTHSVQFVDPWKEEEKKIEELNEQLKQNMSFDNIL